MTTPPATVSTPTISPRWTFEAAIHDPQLEEPINYRWHRPLAFAFLRLLRPIRGVVTPNQITMVGALLGASSGWALFRFSKEGDAQWALLGSVMLLFSVILDCSDGMFARLTGKQSKGGMLLDGIADMVVVCSTWLGLVFAMAKLQPAPWLWPVSIAVLICTSIHVAVFNQMHVRYRRALAMLSLPGPDQDQDQDQSEEATPSPKTAKGFIGALTTIADFLYSTWYPLSAKASLGSMLESPPSSEEAYRNAMLPAVRWTRWLGLGFYMTLIYLSAALLPFAPKFTILGLAVVVLLLRNLVLLRAGVLWRRSVASLEEAAR